MGGTSMNSQDILFQLTNVGSSPVPKFEVTSTPTSSISSPRRWTELFSKKRVKTPSTETPSTASSSMSSFHALSPVRPPSKPISKPILVDSIQEYPSKLGSPDSRGTVGVGKQSTRKNGVKSIKNERCCICGDLCSIKGSNERVVLLQCNHMCHEDCLMVSLASTVNKGNIYEALPKCRFCKTPCVPEQEDMRQKVFNFINETDFTQPNPDPPDTKNPFYDHSTEYSKRVVETFPITEKQRAVSQNMHPSVNIARRDDIRLSIASSLKPAAIIVPSLRDSVRIQRTRSTKRRSNYRGSTISGLSSIISSHSKGEVQVPSLHIQRQYFMQAFLNSFDTLQSWEIDSKYGLLRLIDRFLISLDGKSFQTQVCYLFTEYLLLCQPDTITNNDVLHFLTYHSFKLNNPAHIELLDSTTLELSSNSKEKILIKPSSSDTKPLEKWITALFDPGLTFSSKDFTSMLVPDFVSSMPESNEAGTIIVRRQSTIRISHLPKNADPTSSILTSVSSILSIKRTTPDELNVIIQIDNRKLSDANIASIRNALSALTWKFCSFNCCLVNEDGYIVNCGTVYDILQTGFTAGECGELPFSPHTVYERWFASGGTLSSKSAVLVVSNTSMETGKSCLFNDYGQFANKGKRYANELKVKVGFLNVDYGNEIRELVEIQDWNELLEAVAYSFNLNFEEDYDSSDCISVTSSDSISDIVSTADESDNESSLPSFKTQAEAQMDELISNVSDAIERQQSSMYEYL